MTPPESMEPDSVPPQVKPPPLLRGALPIASVVLGALGILFSALAFGGFFGLVGLVAAIVHRTNRPEFRGLTHTGMALCTASILLSAVAGVYYARSSWKSQAEQAAINTDPALVAAWIETRVPSISFTTLDGKVINLAEQRGKRVIVDCWATWCAPCIAEMPHLMELVETIPEEDLLLIGVSQEDEETVRAFIEENPVNYPIVSWEELPAPFGLAVSLPTTFFIDRNGVIQKILTGYYGIDVLRTYATYEDFDGTPKPTP